MARHAGARPAPLPYTLVLVALTLGLLVVPARAAPPHGLQRLAPFQASEAAGEEPGEGGETEEILRASEEYSEARTAPGAHVPAGAFRAARAQAAQLPVFPGTWRELTTKPDLNDSPAFGDAVASNVGAGWGFVSGRITALVVDRGIVWAGAAAGGLWKSTNDGRNWRPVLDDAPSLSVGSLAVDPADHSLWVGTGEANTNSDAYVGTGVLRTADGGRTFRPVGGEQLDDHLIGRIVFDRHGSVYAATSQGLYRRSASDLTGPWTNVLKPGTDQFGTTWVNDVDVRPGTGGQGVLANVAFGRGGAAYDGFYYSGDGGRAGTWSRLQVTGRLDAAAIGRSTLEWSPDGSRLYAIIGDAPTSGFQGIYVSATGSPSGPYTLLADSDKLVASGSAMGGPGFQPGLQAWYNQFLAVDPKDPDHVYAGLEEVYETRDGGRTWTTPGPYWNFPFACFRQGLFACPETTHPDQHAVAIAGNALYVGNDGGVFRRSLKTRPTPVRRGWTSLNKSLRTLQYYYGGLGRTKGGDAFWGGLQDNGVSLLLPTASNVVTPFGGDGGDVLVDPANADRAVVEYVALDMYRTTNGGRAHRSGAPAFTEFTPSCFAFAYTPDPCDPNPRFIAPFRGDPRDYTRHWVAAGQMVWETRKGFDTTCGAKACDWKPIHDTGPGNSVTGLAVVGDTIYAGWCGGPASCSGSPGFRSGIDTNVGGTWHRLSSPVLPNRFVAAVIADPENPSHVYAVYNGFSRRWVLGAGTGHVFESTNGGSTWTDISGNLPDAPGDDLVLHDGRLTLATDIGVFTAPAGHGAGTRWEVLGRGLPEGAPSNDLTLSPDGSRLVDATHGRGAWVTATP